MLSYLPIDALLPPHHRSPPAPHSPTLPASDPAPAIIYNSATDAHEVAAALAKQYDAKVKAYQCNVGDNAKLKATFKEIEKDLGHIVGVVAVSLPFLLFLSSDS